MLETPDKHGLAPEFDLKSTCCIPATAPTWRQEAGIRQKSGAESRHRRAPPPREEQKVLSAVYVCLQEWAPQKQGGAAFRRLQGKQLAVAGAVIIIGIRRSSESIVAGHELTSQ